MASKNTFENRRTVRKLRAAARDGNLYYETAATGARKVATVALHAKYGVVFHGADWIESAHPVRWWAYVADAVGRVQIDGRE